MPALTSVICPLVGAGVLFLDDPVEGSGLRL